ncbi:MAG: O-antigen ligase family protein [Candidatus Sericytochromatia bacterium]|nr:O-antigen ligase family protein [Candidatus Sericytochromatia bacterium]
MTVSWSERVSRGLELSIYAALPVAVLGPALYMPRVLDDPLRTGAEWAVVVAAWALVLLCAGARAFRGDVPFAARAGAAPWLLAFAGWTVVAAPLARHPGVHLALAMTVVPVLLAIVALGGWIAEAPRRRAPWTMGWLSALLGLEVGLAGLQGLKVPLKALVDHVPREGLLDGLLYAIEAPYKVGVVQAGLGNPNFLAELLVLLVPVVVGLAWGSASRFGRALGLVLGAAGIWVLVMTAARAAFVGLLAAAVVALLVGGLARRRAGLAGLPGGLGWSLALGAAGLLAVAAVGGPLLAKLAQAGAADINITSRLGNWAVAASAWLSSPVWGVGLGGFAADAPRWLLAAHPGGLNEAMSVSQFLEVHNEPLQVLLELGVVGAGLLGFAAWRWERGLHGAGDQPLAWRLGLLAGVVGLGVAGLAGFPGHVPVTAWALALAVALGLGLPGLAEAPPSRLPARLAVPYGLAVVIVLAGTGWLTLARGVGAEWWASHEVYLMKRLQRRDPHAPGIVLLGAAAADHTRIKERVVPLVLVELGRRREFDALLALHDRHVAAGLGFDSSLQRGQALQASGRKAEALPILREVATFYHPATRQHRKAARLLGRMDQPDPRAAEAEALRKAREASEDENGQVEGVIGGPRR